MKHVTFARAMAPHNVGDQRLVPDDVAEQLLADGDISAAEPWPAAARPAAAAKPARPVVKPARPSHGQLDLRVAE